MRSFSRTLALAATIAALTTCFSQEEEFALGRLENPCAGSIPICAFHAACVLGRKDFLSGQMPGGQRFIIQSDRLDRRLVIRLLFTEMIYPGTEYIFEPRPVVLLEAHVQAQKDMKQAEDRLRPGRVGDRTFLAVAKHAMVEGEVAAGKGRGKDKTGKSRGKDMPGKARDVGYVPRSSNKDKK